MSSRKRLSIFYAAPGQNLVPSAGPSRNVLNLASALSQWADVTVAFRSIPEPVIEDKYKTIAIQPHSVTPTNLQDDNAMRGLHPVRHASYCRTLWSFCDRQAGAYDVVLEKGWRLSGYLLDAFRRRGIPGVLVENDVRLWTEPLTGVSAFAKYLLHSAAHHVASRCSRRACAVIAETDELKKLLVQRRGLAPEQIEVVGLGVDHNSFRAMDQQAARRLLNIGSDVVLLIYVGAMDEYHDLEPAIEALAAVRTLPVELHVVGDGAYRGQCEKTAERAQVQARFHGHVLHSLVPLYIAAADLCLAPYRTNACRDAVVPFSTLKIPEYMACARPVVSVPSGAIRRLIEDGVSGFLFPNEVSFWASFFQTLPSRERLASMGTAAAHAVQSVSWEKTAMRYLQVCQRVTSTGIESFING